MNMEPKTKKLITGIVSGLAAFLICTAVFGLSFLISAVLGALVYVALSRMGSEPAQEPESPLPTASNLSEAPSEQTEASSQDADSNAADPNGMSSTDAEVTDTDQTKAVAQNADPSETAPAARAGAVKLGTLLPGEKDVASRKGNWTYSG